MRAELGLILKQAEMVTRQIERAVGGLSEEEADFRLGEGLGSIRSTLTHLADNYAAACAELGGETHTFGTWSPSSTEFRVLVREWREMRKKALDMVRERFRDWDLHALVKVSFATWPAWKVLTEWITLHDAYHLGQICALRLAQDPDWDMYSIYDPDETSP